MSANPHPSRLAHHFDDLEQQHAAATLGMWLFLATEVMFFGGLFLCYAIARYHYPVAFTAGSGALNLPLGATNTAVLLASSLTMALAVRAAQLGERRPLVLFLLLTVVLGTVFLGIKAIEYYHDHEVGLIPGAGFEREPWLAHELNPRHVELFFLLYFIMTGLHAVHMIAGMAVLLVLAGLAYRGRFGPDYYAPIEVAGLYWHFVDVIWIFLFPLFYLVGTV